MHFARVRQYAQYCDPSTLIIYTAVSEFRIAACTLVLYLHNIH